MVPWAAVLSYGLCSSQKGASVKGSLKLQRPSEILFMVNSDKKSWLEDIASPALVNVTGQNDGVSAMLKPVFSFCL